MEIQEEEADDLLLTMEKNLRQRHFGSPVRLEIAEDTPDDVARTAAGESKNERLRYLHIQWAAGFK
ncbi:MAG: hypothetical protein M5U14_19710 [Acidimicrobiia bacterium]|nr:hypothetical protein [Acidimicrobiia bacterium]